MAQVCCGGEAEELTHSGRQESLVKKLRERREREIYREGERETDREGEREESAKDKTETGNREI